MARTTLRAVENTMKIVNLTPHPINLLVNGVMTEFPSDGIARCEEIVEELETVDGIRFCATRYGEVTGLPDPVEGTVYVVSGMALAALRGTRSDVVGLTDYIRNEERRIVGAKALTH